MLIKLLIFSLIKGIAYSICSVPHVCLAGDEARLSRRAEAGVQSCGQAGAQASSQQVLRQGRGQKVRTRPPEGERMRPRLAG